MGGTVGQCGLGMESQNVLKKTGRHLTYVGQCHCHLLIPIIEELGYNKPIKDVSSLDRGLPGNKRLANYCLLLLRSCRRTRA